MTITNKYFLHPGLPGLTKDDDIVPFAQLMSILNDDAIQSFFNLEGHYIFYSLIYWREVQLWVVSGELWGVNVYYIYLLHSLTFLFKFIYHVR